MNTSNDIEQVDIKRMVEIVLERIVSIVIITIVFGMITFALSQFFITPKYESSITMYVNNRRGGLVDEMSETKTLSSDIVASQQLVPTYIEMIKSNNVLDEVRSVVKERHIDDDITVGDLKKMLTVEAVANTEIIRVSVKTTNKTHSKEIANIIADVAPDKIQRFIDRSDVKIIDRAKIQNKPVSPNVRNNTILGALLGLILSISFILLKELFDVRVKSADDLVARFKLPVLGAIPEINISYDEAAVDETVYQ